MNRSDQEIESVQLKKNFALFLNLYRLVTTYQPVLEGCVVY